MMVNTIPSAVYCLFLHINTWPLKRFLKILGITLLAILLLLISSWLLIQTGPVQNWLVHQVTSSLSKDLNTTVEIEEVDFALFNKMLLKGAIVKDRNQDTLLYAGTATVRITDWFFLKDAAVLEYIGLENTSIFLHRKDSVTSSVDATDRIAYITHR